VFGPGALLWFSDCPEGHFRVPLTWMSDRWSGPQGTGTANDPPPRRSLVRYGPERAAPPRAPENRHHKEHEMDQGKIPVYGATITTAGDGSQISGGALVGHATRRDPSNFTFAYLVQGQVYPVTGTPETTWSVTVNGVEYSFSAADEGKTWTAEKMDVATLRITISGKQSDQSPGYLVYWPLVVDTDGFVEPPTSGSTGTYFDAVKQPHTVTFRTTWSVPDFETTFTWDTIDPFSGPYTSHEKDSIGLGDNDTWESGDPSPGQGPDTGRKD
jgi:hypothetical protein